MTGTRGTKTGQTYHSDFERAAGVLLLATNKQNYVLTAEQLGVSEQTIRNWEKESLSKNVAIPVMLEMAIKKLLEMMPDKWSGNSWAVAFGIMMDKWLLVNGQPTQRTESILNNIEELPQEQKDAVLSEADRIIREAISRRNSGGSDNSTSK